MIQRLTSHHSFHAAILWTVSFLPAMWWFASAPPAFAQSWKTGHSTFDGQAFNAAPSSAISELGINLPDAVTPTGYTTAGIQLNSFEPNSLQLNPFQPAPSASEPQRTTDQQQTAALGMPTMTLQAPSQLQAAQLHASQSQTTQLQAASYIVPVDPSLYNQPIVQATADTSIDPSPMFGNVVKSANYDYIYELKSASAEPIASTDPDAGDADPSSSLELSQYRQAINNNISTGAIDVPPLSQQTSNWYTNAWRWMSDGWASHIELGINGAQGNSETFAFQTGAELRRQTDLYTLVFDVNHRLVTAREVTTQDNGRFNVVYDRVLGETPWTYFGKLGLEWDEFKVFDLRVNVNGGLGYAWVRNDSNTFISRFGAGASSELGAPDDSVVAEGLFGFDGVRQVNKYNKVRAKVDYFPDWSDFNNFRVVSNFSWEILLGGSDNLSLKLGLNDRYDSTPQGGADENDFFYSVLLLVKL